MPAPALLVRPPGVASLDEAHAAIRQWEHYSHKKLDSAQRLAVELMMAEGADGRWAARTTGRAESRQNGKGDEIEVVEAWGLTQRAEAIGHTAHEIPTAMSAHMRLVAHLQSHPDLRRRIKKVGNSHSYRAIEMTNGGVIVYRTRTAGGLRGLDDISRLVVDEAQHALPEQLASSTPVLAVNPNPQTNFLGSGGISGKSDWWWELRRRALDPADVGQFAWLEHSAERVSLVGGKVVQDVVAADDRRGWVRANPAYPDRIPDAYLAEQLRVLGPALFAREHLCVWDPLPESSGGGPISPDAWQLAEDADSTIASHHAWALAVAPDRRWASVGLAGRRADGRLHVGWAEHQAGTAWIVDHVAATWAEKRTPIRIHKGGPEAAFISQLRERGVEVVEVSSPEVAQATGQLIDAVAGDGLRHLGQRSLERAVRGAVLRLTADGAALWSQRQSDVEITPLQAVTVAVGGVPSVDGPGLSEFHDLDDFVTTEAGGP